MPKKRVNSPISLTKIGKLVNQKRPRKSEKKSNFDWLDAYKPESADQLAVHCGKISEVSSAIGSIKSSNGPKLLIVTGPTGSAKTTTIKLIAKKEHLKLVEWFNPDFGSQMNSFNDFLSSVSYLNSSVAVIIEELPQLNHDLTRQNFQTALYSYIHLDSSGPSIILMVSEDHDWNVNFVVGSRILQDKTHVQTIKFNPVNKTLMKKTLKSIVAENSQLFLNSKSQRLDELCETGDLRSSILSLEFEARTLEKSVDFQFGPGRPMNWFHLVGRVLFGSSNVDTYAKGSSLNFCDPVNFGSKIYLAPSNATSNSVIDRNPQLFGNSRLFQQLVYENYFIQAQNIEQAEKVLSGLSLSDVIENRKNTEIVVEFTVRSARSGLALKEENEYSFKVQTKGKKPSEGKKTNKGGKMKFSQDSRVRKYQRQVNDQIEFYRKCSQNKVTYKDSCLYHGFYESYINDKRESNGRNELITRFGGAFKHWSDDDPDDGKSNGHFKLEEFYRNFEPLKMYITDDSFEEDSDEFDDTIYDSEYEKLRVVTLNAFDTTLSSGSEFNTDLDTDLESDPELDNYTGTQSSVVNFFSSR